MGYTNFPNGLTSFGVPLPSGGDYSCPPIGITYWVDGTNGLDSNTGLEHTKAFKTIQKAITIQIANATGLGDTIYVLPGTYAESLTGNLSQCKLIGYHPFAVRVTPTSSHAYSGNLHDATISGFMFDSPTTSNLDYAAVRFTTVQDSVITNNLFGKQGGATANSVGVMFGTYATGTTTTSFHRSVFSNNQILNNGGGNCFYYGLGMCSGSGDATNANSRTMWNSRIENNIINASEQGIRLISNSGGSFGTIIKENVVAGSPLGNGQTLGTGIYFLDDTAPQYARIWVIKNYVFSEDDAIEGFAPSMTQGNIVALGNDGAGAPANETGQ
jgi:hypothetical protein